MKKLGKFLSIMMTACFTLLLGVCAGQLFGAGVALPVAAVAFTGYMAVDYSGMMNAGYSFCIGLVSQGAPDCMNLRIGGTALRFMVGYKEDFTLINRPKRQNDSPAPTTPQELTVISTDHTWVATKGVYSYYAENGKVEFDSATKELTMSAFFPGVAKATDGAFASLANALVIGFAQLPDGRKVQIGTDDFPAKFSYKIATKEKPTDVPGVEVTISCTSLNGFMYYEGALTVL